MTPSSGRYPILDVLWSMLIFMAFLLWIWLAITCFNDIFRRQDASGFLKVLWVIVIILVPYFALLMYLLRQRRRRRAQRGAVRRDPGGVRRAHAPSGGILGRRRRRRRGHGNRRGAAVARVGAMNEEELTPQGQGARG